MLTGAEIREARKLLHWPLKKLACRARLTTDAIQRAESVDDDPPLTIANLEALKRALEDAGVEFTEGDDAGVKLRKQKVP